MNTDFSNLLALGVIWTFWLFVTIGLIREEASWFPFTIVVPMVLSVLAIAINRWWLPWGTTLVVAIHAVLWMYALSVWLQIRRERHASDHHVADELTD